MTAWSREEERIVANRRMFSLDVVNTDRFMEMPLTAQALYFHLGMRADDDGFIASPRQIMKAVECKQDDMKILVSKGYVIPFESGIVVIRHWKQHNYIQSDRYRKTKFLEENAGQGGLCRNKRHCRKPWRTFVHQR